MPYKQRVTGSSPVVSTKIRGVAQHGSVLGSGPRGRGFESRHSDHIYRGVAQLVACQNGVLEVAGSNLVTPTINLNAEVDSFSTQVKKLRQGGAFCLSDKP